MIRDITIGQYYPGEFSIYCFFVIFFIKLIVMQTGIYTIIN